MLIYLITYIKQTIKNKYFIVGGTNFILKYIKYLYYIIYSNNKILRENY